MGKTTGAPGLRPSALLAAGLALSIGWGVRGNFGHEYGAMIPGGLAALGVCLLSGREDWRRRAIHFAFFGALGWGFGGSISYMQVIAYTHSGHLPSQLWGFAGLFWIGFLWAALGGAGTAPPAVADRERLTELFRPLLFVFAAWIILDAVESPLEEFLTARTLEAEGGIDDTWYRHKSPLYWLDADWLPAVFALLGVCAFDLWDRRERNTLLLPAFAAGGAAAGGALVARLAYGDRWSGHSGYHLRFGPKADWRIRPNLKTLPHR